MLPKYCDAKGAENWKNSTKCPAYSGHIGINFKPTLKLKPVVQFTRIAGKVPILPIDFLKSLNNDGRYMYRICHAVQNGIVPPDLEYKLISRVDSARYV